ncbi:LIM domain and actin-binding protein 1 [Chytriomyces hyalinus]|nr:LIM domain and actin-binding protein 1 [Chytriomyces hyalinus]
MRDLKPVTATNGLISSASLDAATTPGNAPRKQLSPSLLSKISAYEAKALPSPKHSTLQGPSPRRPSHTATTTTHTTTHQRPSHPASTDQVTPEMLSRRSSTASHRESALRDKFEDSLPSAHASMESLGPKINEAIENLRDAVLVKNPMSPVYVPPSDLIRPAIMSAQTKCEKCNKTVYAMEELTYDDKVFHKSCLKCKHCSSTLKLGNVACLEGEFYCKPHFRQLFALKGNYSEGFGKTDPKKDWVAKQAS